MFLCFCPRAIGLGSELIVANSVIEQPRLHSPGCRSFRDPPGSTGLLSIIGRGVRRYLSAPSHRQRLLPFHLGLPCGSAAVSGLGRIWQRYHTRLFP
jgi:hypothetical protein